MVFTFSREEPITGEVVAEFIEQHKLLLPKYIESKNMYEGNHDILYEEDKEQFKPDNRLVSNFARYIVDISEGYFIGVPVKVNHEDKNVDEAVNNFRKRSDMADNESELSKLAAIYGHSYEYLYQNEGGLTYAIYSTPLDVFVVYDDTIAQKPLFAVRYTYDDEGILDGELVDSTHRYVLSSNDGGEVSIGDETQHYYGEVPIIEYIQNEERQSVFENVKTLINQYNRVLSEKANDSEYFADSYIKILGAELDETSLQTLRDSRIINLSGDGANDVIVEFMNKPNADGLQENLLNRLTDLIYQLSLTPNMNDEAFGGNLSGVSMEFKLQGMKNMAINKERKFQSAMSRRYRMIFALPTNIQPSLKDEWMNLTYTFTRNIPRNLEVESETMSKLEGVVSKRTQLRVSSLVDDVEEELRMMEEENTPAAQYDFQVGDNS